MSPNPQTLAAEGETNPALVPKLRFPEFRGAKVWELIPMGRLLVNSPDYGVNAAAVPYSEKLPKYIRITDISDNGDYLREKQVSVDLEPTPENFLNEGDVVLARTGASVGKSYRYRKEDGRLVFAGFLIRVRPIQKRLNSTYLANFLTTDQYWKWVATTSARSGQPGINSVEFASLAIPLPPAFAEQQKIAECLSSLDELLAAQARKMDALKTHKKGLMQQLFPREGETQPRLRFPEFQNAGEWESKTLVDVCKMQAGKFVAASDIKELNAVDMFPCYGGNGLRGFTETYTHDGVYPLIGRQGALCGNVKLAKRRFHATEHAVVATPKRGIEVVYLYYLLDLLNLNRFATGQAQPGLSVDVLEKVPVTIPSDEHEQHRIATCLSSLDTLITSETQKLDTLKTHKRGLMQQLFPPPEEIAGL